MAKRKSASGPSSREPSLVRPRMLAWARSSAGFDVEQAAKALKVSAAQVRAWEAGESPVSTAQLEKLATLFKRSVAAFYLPRPPVEPPQLHDFRSHAGVRSPGLLLEIRRARYRRRVAIELLAGLGDEPSHFELTARPREDAEDLAYRVREALGVSLETQRRWRDPRVAFGAWRAAIERMGVLVFHATAFSTDEARGFSLTELPLPTIVVNAKDAWAGRVFTLFHELGHLALRRGGVCDLEDGDDVEPFCNAFAASCLVPRLALQSEREIATRVVAIGSMGDVAELAKRYSVSEEAMLRRLVTVGAARETFYRTMRAQLLQRRPKPEKGFAPKDALAIRDAGPHFAQLVVDAYRNEAITAADAAHHLNVPVKYLPLVETGLARKRAAS